MSVSISPMIFFSLAAVLVAALAVFACVVLLRALARERSRRELTPADLKALESAAAEILAEVRQAADDAVIRIKEQIDEAQAVCSRLEALRRSFAGEAEVESDCEPANAGDDAAPQDGDSYADGPASRVRELAESGLNPCEIARETGMGVGEVELLLGLSSRAGTPS